MTILGLGQSVSDSMSAGRMRCFSFAGRLRQRVFLKLIALSLENETAGSDIPKCLIAADALHIFGMHKYSHDALR